MNQQVILIGGLVLLLGGLSGCDREASDEGPQFGARQVSSAQSIYHLAVHPLHNPAKLIQAYQPLVDYLNNRLPATPLVLEASRDYANYEEKYEARKPAFLLPNPWQTLRAERRGYRVIAMAGAPQDFKGIFVARKDSGLKHPTDLKGKAVSYPAPTALAACIMPQYFLHTHGINVTTDIDSRFVGSQESSIMNAYLKLTAVGATWPPPWRAFQKEHPYEAAAMEVIWETEPLVNNSVMVRDDIPAPVAEQVRALLLELDKTEEGKAILAGMETTRFLPASEKDYDVVRQYISRFEQEVRPVENN